VELKVLEHLRRHDLDSANNVIHIQVGADHPPF
jgi:hypothetical protein